MLATHAAARSADKADSAKYRDTHLRIRAQLVHAQVIGEARCWRERMALLSGYARYGTVGPIDWHAWSAI